MSQPDVSQLDADHFRAFAASLLSHLSEQEKSLQQCIEHNNRLTHRNRFLEKLNEKNDSRNCVNQAPFFRQALL